MPGPPGGQVQSPTAHSGVAAAPAAAAASESWRAGFTESTVTPFQGRPGPRAGSLGVTESCRAGRAPAPVETDSC
eukprot:121598-Hanusia_phi.AAC.1